MIVILLEIYVYCKDQKVISQINKRASSISKIANIAFDDYAYIDTNSLKIIHKKNENFDNNSRFSAYFEKFISTLSTESEKEKFKAFVSPQSLNKNSNDELVVKKFASFDPDLQEQRIYEVGICHINLNDISTALVFRKDITRDELDTFSLLKTVTYTYNTVFIGNTGSKNLKLIKTTFGDDDVRINTFMPIKEWVEKAVQHVDKRYTALFLSNFSFKTLVSNLQSRESYSFIVLKNDRHWISIKIIRSANYLENNEFVFLSENIDNLMKSQEDLENALADANVANKAKSEFLSRMSHDIRTPLNGIIGMTYLAQEENNIFSIKEFLTKIDKSSKFLLSLVNDILDMSKIEMNKIELNPEEYKYSEIHKYISSVIEPLCSKKNQNLNFNIYNKIAYTPLLDKLHFNQILFNLLSNAIKYTPVNGKIDCDISTKLRDDKKLEISCSVRDTGRGMEPEFQKVLFEPFTQGKRSDTSENRGSGLGLAITKSLVQLMHGSISVQSTPGVGTTFDFTIVADCIKNSEIQEPDKKQLGSCDFNSLEGLNILLCEDHPLNQEIAQAILAKKGITVSLANNGQEGYDVFKKSSEGFFDVILMDVRMPIKNGLEATRMIRSLDRKDATNVPIIALTANAFTSDINECLAAGMNAHVSKPINPQILYQEILALLKKGSTV